MKLRSGRTIIKDVTPDRTVTQDVQTSEHNCKTIYNKLSNEKKLELSVRLKQVRELTDSFASDFHERFENYPGNTMDNWFKFVLKMRSKAYRVKSFEENFKPNWDKLSKLKKSQVNRRMKQVGTAIEDFAKDFPEIYPGESMDEWLKFIVIIGSPNYERDEFVLNFKTKLNQFDNIKKVPLLTRLEMVGNVIESFVQEFPPIYDKYPSDSMDKLMFISYQKCVELIRDCISITYLDEYIEASPLYYGDNGKKTFIKTIRKLHFGVSSLADMMHDKHQSGTKITKIIELAKPGTLMKDSSALTKNAYMCYRHLNCCRDMYVYEMNTYYDEEYTLVELYDYYFLSNMNGDVKDDRYINDAYNRWFTDVPDVYQVCGCGYTDCPECNRCHPAAFVFFGEDELNTRIEHHHLEADRYTKMKHHMYDEELVVNALE